MKEYLKLIRVHHYIKNLLVFVPLACSGKIFNIDRFVTTLLGWISFCMISSVVYIINDICDKEKDKHHPTKCMRPIAAGIISVTSAIILVCCLILIAALCNGLIFKIQATGALIVYFLFNVAYSMGLKNIPIVDVAVLVSGFVIRVLYGASLTEIEISNWLWLTVMAMAFYFALGKRRNEMRLNCLKETRKVLKSYSVSFLDNNMNMCLTLANAFYALWSVDEKTTALYNNKYLVFTVPIVLLITMKYSLDVEGDMDGDPVEVLLGDKSLFALCICYAIIMFVILYV